jgi:hypothetical protein
MYPYHSPTCVHAEYERETQRLLGSPPFIVAEVSKNWIDGTDTSPTGLLAEQFERVLNINHARGYRLLQFQIHRQMVGAHEMNETIIAVFERNEP